MPFTALFIGRFQPFHLGHLDALQQIIKDKPDKILIGIGSSESELTLKNPLSFYERKELIQKVIDSEDLFQKNKIINIEILPIPDFGNSKKWTNYILQELPYFDKVYSGNPYTQECFKLENKDFQVLELNKFVKAVNIRRLIYEDLSWEKMVPVGGVHFLNKIGLKERLKEIYKFEDELIHGQFWQESGQDQINKNDLSEVIIVEKYTDWECLQKQDFTNFNYSTESKTLKKWHKIHTDLKEKLTNFFSSQNISYKIIKSDKVEETNFDQTKIVISLGGDGTFLAATKKIENQLMIGINSQVGRSVGKLTPFIPQDLELIFGYFESKAFLKNQKIPTKINQKSDLNLKIVKYDRISVKINDQKIKTMAINEVFIGQPLIYKTSHLKVEFKKKSTFFSCNGILISTYQGSTAFYKSGGGQPIQPENFACLSLLTYKKNGLMSDNLILDLNQKIFISPQRLNHSLVFDSDENREIKLSQGDLVEFFVDPKKALKVLIKE